MGDFGYNFDRAADNLLRHCAGMSAGQSLLIVMECPTYGYYGYGLGDDLAGAAKEMGLSVCVRALPFSAEPGADPRDEIPDIDSFDRTVFLSRLGDQLRFSASMSKGHPIVCYALDKDMFASGFGQSDHRGLIRLRDLINSALAGANDIRITCPLGTDVRGSGALFPQSTADTAIVRFPLSVFAPVPTSGFRGTVAQAGFLVGTGSRYYAPYGIGLQETLHVDFEGQHIIRFRGTAKDVSAADAHYQSVGERYGIDPWFIHSWHAGIHPGCAYSRPAGENLERWSGAAFGNPRLLHFHTCGDYPPGEISLNVVDPTISLDGVPVWEDGTLYPERLPGGAALFSGYECLEMLFEKPVRDIGLGPEGRLSFGMEETPAAEGATV